MKKRTILIIVFVLLMLIVLVSAYVFSVRAGIMDNVFGNPISGEEADKKASEYLADKYPEMKDAELISEKKEPENKYWSYVYEKEFTQTIEGEAVTLSSVVIIEVDRSNGEVTSYQSN